MKKLIWVAAILFSVRAWCPPGGGANPPAGLAQQCPSNVAESVICSGYERQWCIDYTNSIIFACNPTTHLWNSVGSAGGGGGGAPVGASYIVKTANSTLTGEFALASLGTGILKSTTSTGNLSIAVASDFPTLNQSTSGNAATASAFDHDPAACLANGFVTDISSSGALGCVQPTFLNISGTIDPSQVPGSFATDNEVTAYSQPIDSGTTGDLTQIAALNDCGGVAGKIMKIDSNGVWACDDDQTTSGGTGITTLNGRTDGTQAFSKTDDTNVTLTITSPSATHNFALGWTGDLGFDRLTQISGLSVLGVAANTSPSDVAGITASTDGNVLRRSGTTLGFGAVNLADTTNAVTGTLPAASVGTGLTDAQVLNDISIAPSTGVMTLKQSAAPTPTAEGVIEWETDVDHIIVGDGSTQTVFVPTNDMLGDVTVTTTGATAIGDNKVTGAMLALGSDATGDIMYYNGTNYVRRPATTDGFVLTLSSGIPIWSLPTGGGTLDAAPTPAATQLAGWVDANTLQGISGTGFDSLGNITATSLTTAPDATLGGCLTLNEGLDDNTSSVNNYAQLCVPDSGGLSANVRYDMNSSGQIPATMIQTGTTAGTSATLTLHDLINGSPTTNDYIKWNGTNWVPAVAAGGLATDSLWTTAGQIVYSDGPSSAVVLAPGTSGDILQSGGTGAPSWTPVLTTTITSEAQGDILYRNASGWVNLAPGTAGRVLTTGGAGANPSWSAVTGTGTVTSIATTAPISGGTITTTGTLSLATNGITDALFRQSAALSVVGNSTNAMANTADIAASADGNVLRRSGTTVGFGAIALADTDAVSGILSGANGGTGNSFISFSGPASTVKTFTLPNATANILTDNAAVTVAQGGTGAATLTSGGILLGTGTSAIHALGVATNGQIPIGDGTTDPVLATITGTANEITVTNGAGTIAIDIPTNPTLGAANITGIVTAGITDGTIAPADINKDAQAWDFQGTGDGSLEIPNGTAPTVNAAGEIAQDTTANQLLFGSAPQVLDPREVFAITLVGPLATDDPLLFRAPYGMTITGVSCLIAGSTNDVIRLQECNTSGASCGDLDSADMTCTTTDNTDTTIATDATVAALNYLKLNIVSQSGTPSNLVVTVTYTVVRE